MAVSVFSGGRAVTRSAASARAMYQFFTDSLESGLTPTMSAMSFVLRALSASRLA